MAAALKFHKCGPADGLHALDETDNRHLQYASDLSNMNSTWSIGGDIQTTRFHLNTHTARKTDKQQHTQVRLAIQVLQIQSVHQLSMASPSGPPSSSWSETPVATSPTTDLDLFLLASISAALVMRLLCLLYRSTMTSGVEASSGRLSLRMVMKRGNLYSTSLDQTFGSQVQRQYSACATLAHWMCSMHTDIMHVG